MDKNRVKKNLNSRKS